MPDATDPQPGLTQRAKNKEPGRYEQPPWFNHLGGENAITIIDHFAPFRSNDKPTILVR